MMHSVWGWQWRRLPQNATYALLRTSIPQSRRHHRRYLLSRRTMLLHSPPRIVSLCVSIPARFRRSLSTYRPSDFHLEGSGYSSTVNTKERISGPLGEGSSSLDKLTPRSLKHHLDGYVVGQEKSKRVLSTAIYHHYKRVQLLRRRHLEAEVFGASHIMDTHSFEEEDLDHAGRAIPLPDIQSGERTSSENEATTIEKSNVLCLGPTGVGKTLILRTLARVLKVPFSMSDCTPFTQAGYVGEDADVCVHRLLAEANFDVHATESGIVCLDEFDKIAKPKNTHGSKDISGEGVQQALLKIIEGTTLQIHTKPERRAGTPGSFNSANSGLAGGSAVPPKGETFTVDTSNILFIFTGAFIGLEKIIADRVSKGSIGFTTSLLSGDAQPTLDVAEPGDLVTYGLIPEIVGRIPVMTAVEKLDEEMLVRVLTEPKNALLKQYERLFELSGVELRFTSPALREVAREAKAMGTGARGLRMVMEKLLSDAMFDCPGSSIKHVLVTEAVAKKTQEPFYFARGQQHRLYSIMTAEEERWASGNQQENESDELESHKERAIGFP